MSRPISFEEFSLLETGFTISFKRFEDVQTLKIFQRMECRDLDCIALTNGEVTGE
jgi:hypothetical protein